MSFIQTASDVCGLSASERVDITDEKERTYLSALQKNEIIPQDEVQKYLKTMEILVRCAELGEVASDPEIGCVRDQLWFAALCKERFQRNNLYRRTWDMYTSGK